MFSLSFVSSIFEQIFRCKHKTNFRKKVPFTAQYYNLNNYPPQHFPRVYYSPAAQNPMSAVLAVQYATCILCGLTAGSSCVTGSCVRACANIYICCDLSRSVQLMADTANVSFMFKLNTGSVVDCDWLDQVGCYGNRSETACFK